MDEAEGLGVGAGGDAVELVEERGGVGARHEVEEEREVGVVRSIGGGVHA